MTIQRYAGKYKNTDPQVLTKDRTGDKVGHSRSTPSQNGSIELSTLTQAQQSVENAAEFRGKFATLHQAAVGVTLCRTREPYRAVQSLQEFAFAQDLDFKVWTITQGWQSYDRHNPDQEPQADGIKEPNQAVMAIQGQGGAQGFDNGVFCMMYPHHFLPKSPAMMQAVKEYARVFAENKKRLVLITPLGFSLPTELEDDVVILDFDPPSYRELSEIYDNIMDAIPQNRRPRLSQEGKDRIVSGMAGMTAQEAENALSRALVNNRPKLPNVQVDDLASEVLAVKTEVVRRSEVLELMDADNMENVGGLENLKTWARKRSKCFSQEARDAGIDPLKGILLAGPPGTGKSLSSKAMASMLGLPLIKFDISKVFQSLVGQSEERVRAATKMLDAMAPCVVMFDEVDKGLGGTQGQSGDSGVGSRILGVLLSWLQETKAPIFAIFTANRVENLPSELLRRGRLDDIFSVSTPDETERRAVLEIHLRKRNQDPAQIENLDTAVEKSNGFVPAELEAAVKDALIESFSEDRPLTGDLIAEQLDYMVPLSEAFSEQFEAMAQWASNNARPANGTSTASRPTRTRTRQRQRPAAQQPSGSRSIDLDG